MGKEPFLQIICVQSSVLTSIGVFYDDSKLFFFAAALSLFFVRLVHKPEHFLHGGTDIIWDLQAVLVLIVIK